jgi:MFS family permease
MDRSTASDESQHERGPGKPACDECGYELAAITPEGHCPECDSPIAEAIATPEPKPSRWGVLRHKHFRRVWIGSFGSSVGGWMEHVGIAWIINTTTQHPALALGYLAAAQLLPMMVLGIPGGLLADRVNRRTMLLVTQALLCVIAAAVAAVSAAGVATPPVLIGLMALMGIAIAFNVPAWQVLTPRLVPREELTNAIFLNGLQFNLARVVGPGLGGLLLSWQGPTALFVINTLSFASVLIAVWTTPDAPAAAERADASPWKSIREALAFVWHSRGPRAAFLAMVVFAFLAVPLMRFMPVFVSDVYWTKDAAENTQEIAYGILLAVMGIGAVAGALAMKLVPKWYPKHHFIPLAILGGGIAIFAYATLSSIVLGAIALVVGGIFWLWAFSSSFAAMQLLVRDEMRGRVMAVCNVATFGAMAAGPVAAALLGEVTVKFIGSGRFAASDEGLSAQIGLAVCGVVLVAAGVVMVMFRTPEVDGLKAGDPGFERRPGLIRGITAAAHRPRER